MADNSQQLLSDVLAQQRLDRNPTLTDEDYFEVFCAEQILKDFNLSDEEITSGIVGGEHDGGIDAVFSFVNGMYITEDSDFSPFKKDVCIELHLIQSKTGAGFNESSLNKLISISQSLFRLDADFSNISQYSDLVKAAVDNFRNAYRSLASKFPKLIIRYHYAAKKADGSIHKNLSLKADELIAVAKHLFEDADVKVEFLGARRLLELARRKPKTSYELRVSKSLSVVNGQIVLCNLKDYYKFLTGGTGALDTGLFESNVRDFQGNTEVNAEITNTLRHDKEVEFWWMNNGVTILASRAIFNGDSMSIENPQIVNGLQTSTQIARAFSNQDDNDNRSILIKVIASEDDDTRDKIIKATNSQNAVQPATLRATHKIQRDIEETLKTVNLFYDRRKNSYKNQGKPADRIVSIPLMAQAIMAIILGKPDSARARPSSLIKDSSVYSQVFSEAHPIRLYSNSILLLRFMDRVLSKMVTINVRDRSNIRFYVLFWLASESCQKVNVSASDISQLDVDKVDVKSVECAALCVWKLFDSLGRTDQTAKGTELRRLCLEALSKKHSLRTRKRVAPQQRDKK